MVGLTLLRLVKYGGVSALVGGSLALALCRGFEDRRRLGLGLVLPGFGVTWTAGFLLAHQVSISPLAPWILGAMGASMVSILAMLFSISKPERARWPVNLLILLPLLGAIFFMIARPE
ncbi:MAG: hypothetical protein RMJ98_01340 [Myxococcales bacterium]|nr:hypothetical protein [Polyangiaceae bacterium]MDW8247931.1 hypothetical protein [Myxococcales bacterium]